MPFTCYDCVYLGTRTIGAHKVGSAHPDNCKGGRADKTITIETPACDKVYLSYEARKVAALEEIARKLKR